MSIPNLLTSSQNEAIEDKYSRNILYFLLRTVCEPILADSMTYEIRSGELFYHCVYSLDSLKGSDVGKMDAYCMDLYDEMLNYSAKKGWNRKNSEVREMACLVAYSVARCLLLTKDPLYSKPSSTIITRLQSENPAYSYLLFKRFNKAINTIGDYKLGRYLQDYMQSPVMLSNEIDAIIEQMPEQTLPKPKRGRKSKALSTQPKIEDREQFIMGIVKSDAPLPEKVILAVYNCVRCDTTDWAVVVSMLEEKDLLHRKAYDSDAKLINSVCGKKVTSPDSLSRSVFNDKIGGKYPNWIIKDGEESRQMPNKLNKYLEIGEIVTKVLQA